MPIAVADHWLRAVFVPSAGEFEIVLTYDGAVVRWPQWASLGAVPLLLLVMGCGRWSRRQERVARAGACRPG